MFRLIQICFIAFLLSSCRLAKDESTFVVLPAVDIYNSAITDYQSKNYEKALEKFSEIQRLYLFTDFAEKSLVLSAYVNMLIKDYDNAVVSCESYAYEYPNGKYLEYMYYIDAISYYKQIVDTSRNVEFIEKAHNAFEELLQRYPEGEYSKDARYKVQALHSSLALKELKVGLSYMKSGHYISAAHRFNKVVDNYNDTYYVAEALYRLYEAYSALGIAKMKVKNRDAIIDRFPRSIWARKLRGK